MEFQWIMDIYCSLLTICTLTIVFLAMIDVLRSSCVKTQESDSFLTIEERHARRWWPITVVLCNTTLTSLSSHSTSTTAYPLAYPCPAPFLSHPTPLNSLVVKSSSVSFTRDIVTTSRLSYQICAFAYPLPLVSHLPRQSQLLPFVSTTPLP